LWFAEQRFADFVEEVRAMKVVVLRSPKALRGLLRVLFRIQKSEPTT
jgi:hypothetical protein